jgi:hypothetical protein
LALSETTAKELEVPMQTQSTAPAPERTTREERALALYREHRDEILLVGPDTYEVPSCSGSRVYHVEYGGENESCTCPDAAFHPERACKHLLAVGICFAKRRRSSIPDHVRIREDAASNPERTYSEHVAAAREIAGESYREECRRMISGNLAGAL